MVTIVDYFIYPQAKLKNVSCPPDVQIAARRMSPVFVVIYLFSLFVRTYHSISFIFFSKFPDSTYLVSRALQRKHSICLYWPKKEGLVYFIGADRARHGHIK